MSQPRRKRQKLPLEDEILDFSNIDEDIEAMKRLSSIESSNNNNNSNKPRKLLAGYRLSNKNKLGEIGDSTPTLVNLIDIKYGIKSFVEDDDKVDKLLSMREKELNARGRGLSSYFIKYKGKDGKIYHRKIKFDPTYKWASPVKKDGGGGSAYTQVEEEILYGAATIMVNHSKRLKLDIKAGILDTGNIGKFPVLWRLLAINTGLAETYPKEVYMRQPPSLKKKVRGWMDSKHKKSLCPKAMRMKSIFAEWPLKMKIINSNNECLVMTKKYGQKEVEEKEKDSLFQYRQSRPVRKHQLLSDLKAKMITMTNQLQQRINNTQSTITPNQYNQLCNIPPICAIPPITNLNTNTIPNTNTAPNTNTNTNKLYKDISDASDPTLVYGVIDEIMALEVAEKISKERKQELTQLILTAYHDIDKQARVVKLLSFVSERGPLFKYLDMIEMDLTLG